MLKNCNFFCSCWIVCGNLDVEILNYHSLLVKKSSPVLVYTSHDLAYG